MGIRRIELDGDNSIIVDDSKEKDHGDRPYTITRLDDDFCLRVIPLPFCAVIDVTEKLVKPILNCKLYDPFYNKEKIERWSSCQ